MKILISKKVLNNIAAMVFFGIGVLVLNPAYIAISSSWDYVVLQMLTFMNGIGLCLVLGLLVNVLWSKRAVLQHERHGETSEEVYE
jgi:hypothetical protein